jgi:hypothetical protein
MEKMIFPSNPWAKREEKPVRINEKRNMIFFISHFINDTKLQKHCCRYRLFSQICTKHRKMKKILFVFGFTLAGFAFVSAQTAVTAVPTGAESAPKAACCAKAGAGTEAKSCSGASAQGKACCSAKTSTASNAGHSGCSGHGHAQAATASNGEKPKGNKKGK